MRLFGKKGRDKTKGFLFGLRVKQKKLKHKAAWDEFVMAEQRLAELSAPCKDALTAGVADYEDSVFKSEIKKVTE
jgi:hypothetical protein